jgi:hypothetical protein
MLATTGPSSFPPNGILHPSSAKLVFPVPLWYNEHTRKALRCSSIQGSGQTEADGLTEAIIAHNSRSRPPPWRGTCCGR